MRAIDYLKRIRTIRGKIRCKEDELQELEKDMASIKAVDYGAVHTTGRPTDISDRIIKVCEMREEIQQQYDKLMMLKAQAQKLISRMPDDTKKDASKQEILIERYLNGKSWENVAQAVNYSWQHTHRLHREALKAFQEVLDAYFQTDEIE